MSAVLKTTMCIYKITNLMTGKMYVGQTRPPLGRRWRTHLSSAKRHKRRAVCPLLAKAMRGYGSEWFRIEVVEACSTNQQLNARETYWIAALNCLAPNGYNLSTGGDSKTFHADTKRKISEANRGRKASPELRARLSALRIGRTLSAESRKRVSDTKKARPHPYRGKRLPEALRIKMSAARKGKRHSMFHTLRIAQAKRLKTLHRVAMMVAERRKGWDGIIRTYDMRPKHTPESKALTVRNRFRNQFRNLCLQVIPQLLGKEICHQSFQAI